MDWQAQMLGISLAVYFLGAVIALILHKRENLSNVAGHSLAALGALLGMGSGLSVLISGRTLTLFLPKIVPFADFYLKLDSLAALFVVVISLAVLLVSIYALGYVTEYRNSGKTGYLGCLYNVFIASMVLVVTAGNAYQFLLAWETMSLVSYLLVSFKHEDQETRTAGYIYLIMTHIGTAFITLAFLVFYRGTGSFDFSGFRALGQTLPPYLKNLVFVMGLIGFGTKAGLVPLHIWLPRAHPVAPSHVSALMSGVMIKTAVYGFLRLVLDFMGGQGGFGSHSPVAQWWGISLILLGVLSALLGVLYAQTAQHIKRLLAYSSVENMGIIFIGIGACVFFIANGHKELAALALLAALCHLVNHGIFKPLLFMGAGSIMFATHTGNIEKLGGLMKQMPQTALAFLTGSLAVSSLPPFNGFIGEWLTIQALLLLTLNTNYSLFGMVGALSAVAVAMTGALAAGTFVKAFGITFLGMPRTDHVTKAVEVPGVMRLAMGLSAVLCLILGIFPLLILPLLKGTVMQLTGGSLAGAGILAPLQSGLANLSPATALLILVATVLGLGIGVKLAAGSIRHRVDETWVCGRSLEPVMEYTGTSFSEPIRRIYSKVLPVERKVERTLGKWTYFGGKIRFSSEIKSVIEAWVYKPLTVLVLALARQIRRLQTGSIHSYLAYIFITLVLLLIFSR